MSDEIIKLLMWAYRQGFLDAIYTLQGCEKVIDEAKMTAHFKELLSRNKIEDLKP